MLYRISHRILDSRLFTYCNFVVVQVHTSHAGGALEDARVRGRALARPQAPRVNPAWPPMAIYTQDLRQVSLSHLPTRAERAPPAHTNLGCDGGPVNRLKLGY